jgi:hypothetical protein
MQKWVQETSTNEEQVSVNEERVRVPERSGWGSGWVNILLGIWVIISPFVLGIHSPKGIWNNVIVGIVVGILAIIRWSMHQPDGVGSTCSWEFGSLFHHLCSFSVGPRCGITLFWGSSLPL